MNELRWLTQLNKSSQYEDNMLLLAPADWFTAVDQVDWLEQLQQTNPNDSEIALWLQEARDFLEELRLQMT